MTIDCQTAPFRVVPSPAARRRACSSSSCPPDRAGLAPVRCSTRSTPLPASASPSTASFVCPNGLSATVRGWSRLPPTRSRLPPSWRRAHHERRFACPTTRCREHLLPARPNPRPPRQPPQRRHHPPPAYLRPACGAPFRGLPRPPHRPEVRGNPPTRLTRRSPTVPPVPARPVPAAVHPRAGDVED